MALRNYLIFILLVTSVHFTLAQSTEQKSEPLHQLFVEITRFERQQNSMSGLFRGAHPIQLIVDQPADYEDRLNAYENFKVRLDELASSELVAQDRISLETMSLKLSGTIDQLKYKNYLIPFNAEGGFFTALSGPMRRLPFNKTDDFAAYLGWLPSYKDYVDGYISLLRQGIREGIVAPKVIVRNSIGQIKPWTTRDLSVHPFTKPLITRPESIPADQWAEIKKEVMAVMKETVWPACDELLSFFETTYLDAAYDAPGISNIPNGTAYYDARVAYYTTFDMTAEEVFQTGLQEVSRIRGLMEGVIEETGFEGDFAAFLEYLRTDPQFYAKNAQELLSYAAWLSKKAEGQLPRLFSHLYQIPFTVEPVPDDIAPTYTGGRYVQGSRSQDRPGIYWVNTYNLPARSLYNIPALTVHEAVPGHHLQIMLAAELKDIPAFRNRFYISAFGEGWGLYSEFLGEEMGMYATPYDRFGRYTYEMWRACRLVVDVGLHVKGWTREEAVQYLAKNTALSLHEVNTEIDRYIGWPGQAVSYKIGELKIKELRNKAEEALGDRFDIKEFHYRVLRNGSIPLPTLEREIEEWIAEYKN